MKTSKKVLYFCNKFTFYDHYNIERLIELNHVRDYILIVLSESDFIYEEKRLTCVRCYR